MIYSKQDQLKKNRDPKANKLSKAENIAFIDTIRDISDGMCQLCGARGDDIHHPEFGRMGADRNMKCALLVCRSCHDLCHMDKHGDLNMEAVRIGMANYDIRRKLDKNSN